MVLFIYTHHLGDKIDNNLKGFLNGSSFEKVEVKNANIFHFKCLFLFRLKKQNFDSKKLGLFEKYIDQLDESRYLKWSIDYGKNSKKPIEIRIQYVECSLFLMSSEWPGSKNKPTLYPFLLVLLASFEKDSLEFLDAQYQALSRNCNLSQISPVVDYILTAFTYFNPLQTFKLIDYMHSKYLGNIQKDFLRFFDDYAYILDHKYMYFADKMKFAVNLVRLNHKASRKEHIKRFLRHAIFKAYRSTLLTDQNTMSEMISFARKTFTDTSKTRTFFNIPNDAIQE